MAVERRAGTRSTGAPSPGDAAGGRSGPWRGAVQSLAGVLVAGAVLLLAVGGAASRSLLPGQLDDAGRQACALTLALPGAAQRAEAVALAGRSGEQGLREAAGSASSASLEQRFGAVEHWCASHD